MDLSKSLFEISQLYAQIKQGDEEDILYLLDVIECKHRKIQALNRELEVTRNVLRTQDVDQDSSRKEVRELKAQLVEARSQVAALISAKKSIESENQILERQMDTVRDILKDVPYLSEVSKKKLEFLNQPRRSSGSHEHRRPSSLSILSEYDIDYDKTDDDLDLDVSYLRGGKKWRHSTKSGIRGRKRSRSAPRAQPTAPIQEEAEPTPKKRPESKVELAGPRPQSPGIALAVPTTFSTEKKRLSMNKSFSEPRLLSPQGNRNLANTPYATGSAFSVNAMSPALNIMTPTGCLSARRHTFLTRTLLKPEQCDACVKRVAFSKPILRCQDCKTHCHPECREKVTYPCIPRGTPVKGQKGRIADFVPQVPPMVPHILIHCVNEIERRGLDSLGLYRIPGTETKVNELLDRFLWGKGVPNVKFVEDVNTIAGCVKKFLQQLKEPLVPATSWAEFVRAADAKDNYGQTDLQALHRAIAELPLPNKDTLSFLILHLQRVAASSERNKMSAENLAKVFGPTIVGYSSETDDLHQCLAETGKQEKVILSLLALPADYWTRLVNSADVLPLIIESQTPEVRYAPAPTFACTPTTHFPATRLGSAKSAVKSAQKKFFPPWK